MAERRHFVCGSTAGVSASLLLQPLDVIKTCILVQHKSDSIRNAVSYVYEKHGISGFWRGSTPAVWRSIMGGGMNFFLLEYFKLAFASEKAYIGKFATDGQAAAMARGITIIAVCPFSVIKVRMEAPQTNHYNSLKHAMQKIYTDEGVKGFYKGLSPNLMRDIPYAGLAYAFYVQYLGILRAIKGMENEEIKYESITFFAGCLAGFSSAVLTQPFDIIKTRLMFAHVKEGDHHNYTGLFNGLANIWKFEGIKGLTRGIQIRILERSCSFGILWFVYEKAKSFFDLK